MIFDKQPLVVQIAVRMIGAVNRCSKRLIGVLFFVSLLCAAAGETTLQFAGYTWVVRSSGQGGPGPNHWDERNAWVDTNGWLHLRLTKRDDRWYAAEVYTRDRLGFGQYQFSLSGRLDTLDPNVVLGLFTYPSADIGPDATHEIDIEFAKWGRRAAPVGNYTVWPTVTNSTQVTTSFPFECTNSLSLHEFTWRPTSIRFQSFCGPATNGTAAGSWSFEPAEPGLSISQKAMRLHINLWCFQGKPPLDGQPVEFVLREFRYKPLK